MALFVSRTTQIPRSRKSFADLKLDQFSFSREYQMPTGQLLGNLRDLDLGPYFLKNTVLSSTGGSKFTLLKLAGHGAMGFVYEAIDQNGEKVALKIPKYDNGEYLLGEGEVLGSLGWTRGAAEHLPGYHSSGIVTWENKANSENRTEGIEFVACRFVDGEDVSTVLRREGSVDPLRALNIVLDVSRAIAAVTEQGIVHRDIKPGNIMLTKVKGNEVGVLLDFGLATTSTGNVAGTPYYMSLDQIMGAEPKVGDDIYALGATLFEMITGEAPFALEADNRTMLNGLMFRLMKEKSATFDKDFDGNTSRQITLLRAKKAFQVLEDLIIKMMHPHRERGRYTDCGQLEADVRRVIAALKLSGLIQQTITELRPPISEAEIHLPIEAEEMVPELADVLEPVPEENGFWSQTLDRFFRRA